MVLAAVFVAGWGVDRLSPLPLLAVRVLCALMGAAALGVAVRWVVLPWLTRMPVTRLAALVEQQYPVLGERLWTLSQMPDSDAFPTRVQQHLAEETEELSRDLNFASAFSWHNTRQWARFAAGSLTLLCLVFAFAPSSRAFAQRLVHCFGGDPLGYELAVEPGDAFVARGRPAIVSAQMNVTRSFARLPKDVYLIDDAGQRLRMEPVDGGRFAFPLAAEKSLRYRVAAGDAVSREYTLTFVPPTGWKSPPSTVVTPPPYVSADHKALSRSSGSSLVPVLQYSAVRWVLSFDQPLVAGTLRWRKGEHVFSMPIKLKGTEGEATCEVIAREVGNFLGEVRVTNVHGIESILTLPMTTVWKDTPPQFTEPLQRGASTASLDPEEVLKLRVAVEDAVGLDRLDLEYVVNNDPPRREPLLNLAGKTAFQDDLLVPLRGKVKEGDRLQIRLVARDNRRLKRSEIAANVPDADLPPQSTYEPAPLDGQPRWLSFQVGRAGDSPQRQALLEEHKNIARKLTGIRQELEREQQLLKHVHKNSHQMPRLSPEQNAQVLSAQKINHSQQENLRKLGQELFATGALRPLSRTAFDIADKDLGPVSESIEKIATGNLPSTQREEEFYKDDRQLHQAIQRVADLLKTNDELAKNRLQQEELERITRKEEALAEKAAALGNLDPKLIEKELAELRAQQEKLLEQLRNWAEKNPTLQSSLAQARQAQMLKLSEKADELAKKQRAMSAADQAKLLEKFKKEFADLAEKQQALAGKADELRSAVPGEMLGTKIDVPAAHARQAADLLRAGQVENAIGSQGKTLDDLTELTPRLRQALLLGNDLGIAARKLADLQRQVRQDFAQLVKDAPKLATNEAVERFQVARALQQMIHDAAGALPVPASSKAAQDQIRKHARDAAAKIHDKDAPAALDAMLQTRDKLDALARLAPEAKSENAGDVEEQKRIRAQGEKSLALAGEQRALQEETYKRLAELMKHHGNGAGAPGGERAAMEKDVGDLAKDLMKLSQSVGDSPEAKSMAAESAMAAEQAKDLLDKSKAESNKGNLAKSAQMDNEAALKLELAGKKAEQAALAMKAGDPQTKPDPLAQSFQESEAKMQQAAKQLSKSAAPEDLKLAADALKKTSQMSGDLFSQRKPTPPGAAAPAFDPARDLSLTPDDFKNMKGKPWGELPGELRARIVEELRGQFGEEYGPIIQRYFQRLAEEPGR
jgi:hypothetical protein